MVANDQQRLRHAYVEDFRQAELLGECMNREGTLHIVHLNSGDPKATPRYQVTFASFSNDERRTDRQFVGDLHLKQFLALPCHVHADVLDTTLSDLRTKHNASVHVVFSDEELGMLRFTPVRAVF